MANPLHKFTVVESNNLQVYEDYYVTSTDISTSFQTVFLSTTAGSPAKQIILTSAGSAVIEADDIISVVLNDEDDTDASKTIVFNGGSLPFTIDNMIITKVEVKTSDDTANETIGCIAFM
tara:strand:- start:230 stop:589 length:360 start_codon:yes stop_codon:yes gene_type:complete